MFVSVSKLCYIIHELWVSEKLNKEKLNECGSVVLIVLNDRHGFCGLSRYENMFNCLHQIENGCFDVLTFMKKKKMRILTALLVID